MVCTGSYAGDKRPRRYCLHRSEHTAEKQSSLSTSILEIDWPASLGDSNPYKSCTVTPERTLWAKNAAEDGRHIFLAGCGHTKNAAWIGMGDGTQDQLSNHHAPLSGPLNRLIISRSIVGNRGL